LALAARAGFGAHDDVNGNAYFTRSVPPLAYTDGIVTIRRQRLDDLDADLEAKDNEQIDWLWLPGQRETWEAMSAGQQRVHALRNLERNAAAFGAGPKWTFAVDGPDADYVAYVDCDLANEHVPVGEANISYSSHPAHRGQGYVSRAVRLIARFVADHTGAREAHIVVDTGNTASLRVAHAVGAAETGRWVNEHGRTMVRHVLHVASDSP
jgi:RimJ/RimL family protein N-acetyltransferase